MHFASLKKFSFENSKLLIVTRSFKLFLQQAVHNTHTIDGPNSSTTDEPLSAKSFVASSL